jgi:zinc/manganese transport system substrate-binding protein
MRIFARTTLVFACALAVTAGSAAASPLHVVTTTPDIASIVREVGGDLVEVEAIARGYQDPHYVAAKPSYMRRVNRADLLVYTGLQLEIGWLPLLVQGARNPNITPGSRGDLDASPGIEVLEVPVGELSRAMGDIHPEGNPHYMLDPRNAGIVAGTVRDRLAKLAPGDAAVFDRNLEAFRTRLAGKIAEWEEQARPLQGRKAVAYHKQWEYLANWLGLEILDYVEEKPGIPPGPRHLAHLEELIPAEGVKVILCANFADTGPAEAVAERTGTELLALPASVGGEEGTDTYLGLLDHLVSKLVEAYGVE